MSTAGEFIFRDNVTARFKSVLNYRRGREGGMIRRMRGHEEHEGEKEEDERAENEGEAEQ